MTSLANSADVITQRFLVEHISAFLFYPFHIPPNLLMVRGLGDAGCDRPDDDSFFFYLATSGDGDTIEHLRD